MSSGIPAYRLKVNQVINLYDKAINALTKETSKEKIKAKILDLFQPDIDQSTFTIKSQDLIKGITEFLDKYIKQEIFKPNDLLSRVLKNFDQKITPNNIFGSSTLAVSLDTAIEWKLLEHVDIKETDNGGLKIIFPPEMKNLKSITLKKVDDENRSYFIEFHNSDYVREVQIQGQADDSGYQSFDNSLDKIQSKLNISKLYKSWIVK
ncbi:MAG: hypothetical protein MK033_00745 [Candidatus Caenarcaniphilales bacterium]|nr:hypothetical protein [Candidatus Caenarcaniphilales bacterium]